MRYMCAIYSPVKGRNYLHFCLAASRTKVSCLFFLHQTFRCYFRFLNSSHLFTKKSLHLGKLELAKSETEGEVFLWIAFSSCRRQAGAQQVDSLVSERFSWMDFFHWLQPFPYCSHSHPPTHTQVNVNINSFGHIRKDSKPQVIYSFSLSEGESKSITVA